MTESDTALPEKKYWLDDKANVKKILKVFYVICAVLFALDFVIHRHVYHALENIWGFYALYGFVACVVLVLVAREMRKVLMRDEDYYERSGSVNHELPEHEQ